MHTYIYCMYVRICVHIYVCVCTYSIKVVDGLLSFSHLNLTGYLDISMWSYSSVMMRRNTYSQFKKRKVRHEMIKCVFLLVRNIADGDIYVVQNTRPV